MLKDTTITQVKQWAEACGGIVAVSVRNISNATNFSLNDDVQMGSASTIKVPMLLEALRQVRDGELSLDTMVEIAADQCCPGSGVLTHLHPGVKVTIKDLLVLMTIVSDNTATNVVMDIIGIDNVNVLLNSMGFTGTALQRKMFDWAGIEKGLDNFIVAREMTELLAKLAQGQIVGGEWDQMAIDIMRHQLYSDELGLLLPKEAKLANKTGQREEVVHDCGIITTDKFRYSIAICTKDVNVPGEAKIVMGRISKAIYDDIAAANA